MTHRASAAVAAMIPDDRFARIERLDAHGATFSAFDRRLGRQVIVKSLAALDAVTLYQLRVPLERLRKIFHENLAPILDVSLVGRSPFIVRDFVVGEPLGEAFKHSILRGENSRAAEWLGQILGGLDRLAGFGFSHGNLKAPNIWLGSGRVVLLDGGLKAGDALSDLAALIDLLRSEIHEIGSAAATPWRILSELQGEPKYLRAGLHDLIASFDPAPEASPILLDGPFVGREAELSQIHQAALRTRRGQSVTMLVEAAPGLGRSALLARSKRLIEQRHDDALVLSAACRRATRRGGAMAALLLDLVERLSKLPPREVEVLLPARPRELAIGFPIFLRLEAVALALPAPEEGGESGRERSVLALRQLFDRIGERRPLVLVLDDAERADAQSLEILGRVLEPPDPPPMMLLIGLDESSARSRSLTGLIAPEHDKTASFRVERLMLNPLNRRDSRRMARTLIGTNAAKEVVEEIAASAEGLPAWIVRLVDDSLDTAASEVEVEVEGASNDSRRMAALMRRLGEVSASAGRLLYCLALINRPVAVELARAFCDPDEEPFETVIDQLLSEDLVRSSDPEGHFVLTDRLITETLRSIAEQNAGSLHAHIAWALEEAGAPPGELARHWHAAGQFAKAREAACVGAQQAAELGCHDEAADLWQLALGLTPKESPECLSILRSSAAAHDRVGDFVRSAEAFSQASKLDPDSSAPWLRLAADRRMVNGDQEGGLELLAPLLEKTGLRPLAGGSGVSSEWLRRPWRRLRRILASLDLRRRASAEDLLAVDVAWTLCRGLRISAPGQAEELSQEHLVRALWSRDPYRLCRALALETAIQAYGGWRGRARVEKLGRRAVTLARQLDMPRARGLAEVMTGEAWLLLGEWRRALSALDRGQQILESECPEAWWERRVAFFQQLRCLGMIGELAEISHLVARYPKSDAVNRAPFLRQAVESRFSWLVELAEDRPREALETLERRRHEVAEAGHRSYWLLYGEIEVAIYRGDVHFAWHHLEQYWLPVVLPRLANIEFLSIEAWHLRARAALAALAMRPEGADSLMLSKAAAQALGALQAVSSPWSDAAALMVQAGLESLSADRYAAAETLQRAESRLDHLGMKLAVQACRRQRARLVPSAVAVERLADADRRLSELGVASPESMAALYVPGQWHPTS